MKDKNLRDQALRALNGADQFLPQLMAAIRMGPENLYSASYAVKARVKAEDSLVEKVLERRRAGKEQYTPFDASDIIGIRFLCIHSSELIDISRRITRLLPFLQSPPVQLVNGATLDQAIREVVVYKTASSSEHYDECLRFFEELPELPKTKVRLERLDKRAKRHYSSIHIVCEGRAYVHGIRVSIPIEIQIRTAFEDVWGEIQHRIEYKAKKLSGDDEILQARLKTAKGLLDGLKRILDGCTHQADELKHESDSIRKIADAGPVPTAPTLLRKRTTVARIESLPEELRVAFRRLDEELDTAFGAIPRHEVPPNSLSKVRNRLVTCITRIDDFATDYEACDKRRFAGDDLTKLILGMDKALCLFWLFRLPVGDPNDDKRIEQLDKAIAIYRNLYAVPEYSKNSLLEYRLAYALMSSGDDEQAIGLLESALHHMRGDPTLEEKDVFKTVIPRTLGLAYWRSIGKSAEVDPADSLEQAIVATARAFDGFDASDVKKQADLSEAMLYCLNNLISYIGELFVAHHKDRARRIFSKRRSLIDVWLEATSFEVHSRFGEADRGLELAKKARMQQTLTFLALLKKDMTEQEFVLSTKKLKRVLRKHFDSTSRELRSELNYLDRMLRSLSDGAAK